MDASLRQLDAAGAKTYGDYLKANYVFNRYQYLTNENVLSLHLIGQWANDNLNASEKFSLGGSYGVRAYPQGEASGDSGAMLNIELLHSFTPQVQAILFYDYGQVKINHDNFTQASNERAIAGAGVGVNAKFSGFSLNSYLAWRTQGGIPLSEPSSEERTPRLWFQISREF